MTAHLGFNTVNWKQAPVFGGHCATPADLEAAGAVFALADTVNGRPKAIDKPAPVIWYSEEEQFSALVVQAETHETEEDEELDFLGLLLPSGETVVVFPDDVEFVDGTDPVWLALLEADSDEDLASADENAEWAGFHPPGAEDDEAR